MTYRVIPSSSVRGIGRLHGIGSIYSAYSPPPAPPSQTLEQTIQNAVNTASDTVSSMTSTSDSEDGMSTGMKAAIGIGAVVAVAGVVYVMKKRK